MLLDIVTFLGHLHPLVVHLPVGFLLLAFIFQVVSYTKKALHLQQAIGFILLLGFIAAVLACIFGYLLSLNGGYERATLRQHKWAGISVAIVSGLLYLVYTKQLLVKPVAQLISLGCMTALIAFTGHQGGALTHGSDYLTLKTLTHQKRPKPASLNEAYIFEDVVQPILQTRCGQCHQGSKLKGKLSIETLQSLLKGGKTGAAVVAFKPMESELYKRVTLSPSDEKFMPTDGKTPLTKNETAIIKWWIDNGAVEEQKLVSIKNKDSISSTVSAWLGFAAPAANGEEQTLTQKINSSVPSTTDTAAIASLQRKGWMVRWMLKQPAMLDITKPTFAKTSIEDAQADLQKLSKNIIWLNLAGNNLSDKDLAFLNQLSNLEKLRLEKNPLTDEVCQQLISLQHLESVNLYDTNVSEKGLAVLKKNAAIKRIYSWNESK